MCCIQAWNNSLPLLSRPSTTGPPLGSCDRQCAYAASIIVFHCKRNPRGRKTTPIREERSLLARNYEPQPHHPLKGNREQEIDAWCTSDPHYHTGGNPRYHKRSLFVLTRSLNPGQMTEQPDSPIQERSRVQYPARRKSCSSLLVPRSQPGRARLCCGASAVVTWGGGGIELAGVMWDGWQSDKPFGRINENIDAYVTKCQVTPSATRLEYSSNPRGYHEGLGPGQHTPTRKCMDVGSGDRGL